MYFFRTKGATVFQIQKPENLSDHVYKNASKFLRKIFNTFSKCLNWSADFPFLISSKKLLLIIIFQAYSNVFDLIFYIFFPKILIRPKPSSNHKRVDTVWQTLSLVKNCCFSAREKCFSAQICIKNENFEV